MASTPGGLENCSPQKSDKARPARMTELDMSTSSCSRVDDPMRPHYGCAETF